MRERRDEHGRFKPGASGNPAGRKPASAYAKLLAQAARVGAFVAVLVPPAVANGRQPQPPVTA